MRRRQAMVAVLCFVLFAMAAPVPAAPVQLPGAPGGEVATTPRTPKPAARPGAERNPGRSAPPKAVISPRERARRKQLFTRARAGDTAAMRALAGAYVEGALGLKRSQAKAATWLRRAAQAGDAEAAHELARMLMKGGEGVKRAPKIAAALFKAAAEKGHVPSMYWLAHMLEFGIGVPKDVKAARAWYEKAADKGHLPARVALGLMALTGRGGDRDFEMALDHFSKAAEKGDGWALNNLGAMFEMGWGVPKDREKAIIYYELAKERQNPAGLRNLVRLGAVQMTPPSPEHGHGTATGNAVSGSTANANLPDNAEKAQASTTVDAGKNPARPATSAKRYNFRPGRPVVNTP